MVFDWLSGKYEAFSLVNSWYLSNKVKLARDLQSLSRNVIIHDVFSAAVIVLVPMILIVGRQIVHINEGKGKLAHFITKDNVYLPHTPPTPPQLFYFPFLVLPFIFNFHPRPHRPHIDVTAQ